MNALLLVSALTFPGAAATACEPARFVPVMSEDGQTVLYWTNATCVYAGSFQGDTPPVEEDE